MKNHVLLAAAAAAVLLVFATPAAAQCPVTLHAPAQVTWNSDGNQAYITGAPFGSSTTWSMINGTITSTSPDQTSIIFSVNDESPVTVYAVNQCSMNKTFPNIAPEFDCDLSVDKHTLTATSVGGARTLNVTATCDWTLYRVPAWITVPGGTTGSGNGAIGLNVAANPYSYPRSATMILNEENIVVTQQGNQFHGPDFNNDGKTDLLWRNATSGVVFAAFGDGPMTNGGRHLTAEANPTWRIVAAADANGDGYSDLLWKNFPNPVMFPNGGGMFLQWVDPSGVSAGEGKFVGHAQVVGFGQVVPYNGLFADVLMRDTFDGAFLIAAGTNPGSFGNDPRVLWREPDQNWKVVAIDDFDGNGNMDILWRHAVNGTCFIVTTRTAYWYVKEAGVYHYEPDLNWQIVDTADLNGDGMADVIWRNTDGRVWVQLMNGFTQIGGGVVWTEPDTNWRIKGTGDFNGDGKGDILFRHQTTGEVFVLLLDGTTVLSATVMHREPSLDWKLILPNTSAASYDGDNSTP